MVETTIPFKNLAFYEISQHRYVIARILEGKRMRRRPSETRRTTQEKKHCVRRSAFVYQSKCGST